MELSGINREVSIKILRPKTKDLICHLLNPQMFICAPNGTLRYWRGLVGLCKINPSYEASLLEDLNPMKRVLNLWYEKDPDHSTVQQFLLFLEEMDRFDVYDDIIEQIDEDIKAHEINPQLCDNQALSLDADRYIITTDDVNRIREGLQLEIYDAFLLYDQDDINFAIQVLNKMEGEYNMKFCVKDRDLVGGGLEMDKMITLITERCQRLVVILSDSFFKSSSNDYLLRFAQAYGIESKRKIIPCVYKDLTHNPPHTKYLFTLDYRRSMSIFNFWDKLRDSIRVAELSKVKIARSRSDNGQALKTTLQEHRVDNCRLKPLQHCVKFSSSVGNLSSLESVSEPSLNPSTSADHLGPYLEEKKEKKSNWLKRIKGHLKKSKTSDCMKQEREKNKGFRKHIKTAAAVAN